MNPQKLNDMRAAIHAAAVRHDQENGTETALFFKNGRPCSDCGIVLPIKKIGLCEECFKAWGFDIDWVETREMYRKYQAFMGSRRSIRGAHGEPVFSVGTPPPAPEKQVPRFPDGKTILEPLEDRLRQACAEHPEMGDRQLAKLLGVGRTTVWKFRTNRGLRPQPSL